MSTPITLKVIESQIATLNNLTKIDTAYSKYDLCQAYGGVKLVLRSTDNGSESDISTRGTKRELSNTLSAMITMLRYEA